MPFAHSSNRIDISGDETGDSLRSYIVANSLGTVIDKTTVMGRSILLADNASFTDIDCTWIFPSSFHWDFDRTLPTLFELVDAVVIYTQGSKGHTSQPRATTLRLVNVQYRIEGETGRTDFFNFRDSGFEFSNVQFISYGGSNFLHLPTTGGLLENVSVFGKTGSLTFQPDCNRGQELIMRNWVLDNGIDRIIGNGGGDLTAITRLENLSWERTLWQIGVSGRGQYYKVINPIKPDGWTGYRGSSRLSTTRCDEFHTHNVKVVDESNASLENFKVQLRRSDNTTVIYDLLTNIAGDIPEQEVITFEQTGDGTDFTPHEDFLIGGISYNNSIISGTKALQNGRIDEVILSITDGLVSELDKSVVDGYPIVIDLTDDTLTVSGDGGVQSLTSQQLYDILKSILTDNYSGEVQTVITRNDTTIDARALNVVFTDINMIGAITTSGVVTLNNSTVSDFIIDTNGIVLSITSDNGLPFNILARRTDTGAEFAYQHAVLSASFQVPVGVELEVAAWQLGKQTSIFTTQSSTSISFIDHTVVDTDIDTSPFTGAIDLSLAPNDFGITFNQSAVFDIELMKAIIHKLLGRENSLRAGLLAGAGSSSIEILSDEIRINLPIVFVRRGASLTVAERVELSGFLNIAPARALNPLYIPNPNDANNQFVLIPSVKPALDPSQLAKAVWDENRAALTLDHSRAANIQTRKVSI